jgi:hypothetical protein
MSSGYNINIVKGATFAVDFNFTNSSGTPINLSGYSGQATLKNTLSTTSGLGNLELEFTSEVSGSIRLSMDATGTAVLPVTQAVYDVDFYSPLGVSSKVLYGYADIYPDIGPITSSQGAFTVESSL